MNLSLSNFEAKKRAWAHKHQKGIVITRKVSFGCAVFFAVLWVTLAILPFIVM